MSTGAGLQNEQGKTKRCLSYFPVVLKHHAQGKTEKEGLVQASGSRGLRVHHHHKWEVWQQADLTAGQQLRAHILSLKQEVVSVNCLRHSPSNHHRGAEG